MNITVTQEGNPTVIALEGKLDTLTSPELEQFANALYEKGVNNLEINLQACEFVSSAGLRVIVALQKRAVATEGTLVFCNVQPDVMDVFQMTGFNEILDIR